ncbi:MAG: SAM-dependent methyltransferase, partial [Armatimonadota bacterium]
RILKPGGWVVLMWNERPSAVADDDGFLIAYDQLLHTFSPDYASVDHRNTDHVKIQAFFDSFPVVCDGCPNQQTLDLPSLEGRLLSSSYAPEAGQEGHEEMMLELRRIFLKHARNGNVVMPYQTRVYMGQL